MIDLLIQPFKEMFSFQGRATRKEFWTFAIFWGIIIGLLAGIGPNLRDTESSFVLVIIFAIIYLVYFIAQLSLAVRRLHDINKSGWWYWLFIIPIVGSIWLFVLFCFDGTKGKNHFGPDSKKR